MPPVLSAVPKAALPRFKSQNAVSHGHVLTVTFQTNVRRGSFLLGLKRLENMNRGRYGVPCDSDYRPKVTLDDVIRYTRGETIPQMHYPKEEKSLAERSENDHSVSLLSGTCGLNIYVSKGSPLLIQGVRQRFQRECSLKKVDCLEKSKKTTPIEYKSVKSDEGCERVTLPPFDQTLRLPLVKFSVPQTISNYYDTPSTSVQACSSIDNPPPLVVAPIFKPNFPTQTNPVEVEETDEMIQAQPPEPDVESDEINEESGLSMEVLEVKKMYCGLPRWMAQQPVKTLNEHFTMLNKNFQTN